MPSRPVSILERHRGPSYAEQVHKASVQLLHWKDRPSGTCKSLYSNDVLHAHNDALMCKVFPSSLGPTALRWFNRLKKGSVHSFSELIQEFGVRFMTCSRVPQPVDALLSIRMGAGEALRNYANRYWGNEKIAASIFRMGLPEESGLRESLTLRPPKDMRQLMRRIEEYKRLKDDWLQTKGKAPIINFPWNIGFSPRHRKDLRIQEPGPTIGGVNATFKEPMHRIIDRIKNESYFKLRIGWWATHREETRICIAPTIEIKGTPPSSAGY
ncbi:uncharacterized protein LOC142632539 [Castanea sativa]|uniref:uncharacterized protein LOC142632539 n=1 Tax=Castanea sativa TaxID=21020 RepID=UPI003F650299